MCYDHLLNKNVYHCSAKTIVLSLKRDVNIINNNRASVSMSLMLFYACSQNHIDFNCFIKNVFLAYSRNEGDKIWGDLLVHLQQ